MSIPDILFLIAGGLCAVMALLHELKGSPLVLPPLSGSALPDSVAGLHAFSWHAGTVLAFGMASLFALAVWHPAGDVFAIVATIMSGGMGAIAIALATVKHKALWGTPAPYPWNVIALTGLVGVLLG